ncbi:hypothetical protein [Gymnodinialimonas ceratoperidinii]|uniref:Uncharacterized protein n=1 Tax=Gymnodinialimonas ceratoperidinii TaxID=2856823 RepID=A0A8F6YC63_9RHOB|nr:hypothetical protein [Gymnodinialimonas ceratoperidinii]QXT41243.1 hypothetical protein KYE46_08550 [Gymnodinialimonas ceratoperidinii]
MLPRFLSALTLCALSVGLSSGGQAQEASQDFLTRAEITAHMDASAFCYFPDARTSCAWAEIYVEQNADHVVLVTASATWDNPMEVARYRIDWRGDALCIPYEDQGLQAMWEAEGYRFPFDLDGFTALPDEMLPARREELRETSPREFCFQYSADPENANRLLQHVFRDGVWDAEQDPIALVPRFASGVAIRPN